MTEEDFVGGQEPEHCPDRYKSNYIIIQGILGHRRYAASLGVSQ